MPQPQNVREGHRGENSENSESKIDPMLDCRENDPRAWNADYQEESSQDYETRNEANYDDYPEYFGEDWDEEYAERASLI